MGGSPVTGLTVRAEPERGVLRAVKVVADSAHEQCARLPLCGFNGHRSGLGVDVRAGSGAAARQIGRRQARLGSLGPDRLAARIWLSQTAPGRFLAWWSSTRRSG